MNKFATSFGGLRDATSMPKPGDLDDPAEAGCSDCRITLFRGAMNTELVEMVEYSFGSVWTLELLLLLHRDRNRAWPREELVRELRSSEQVVAEGINRLVSNGLILIEENHVRYAPASQGQDELVRQLEEEYRVKPAAIRRMIVQGPAQKLRSFSDAFKLNPR